MAFFYWVMMHFHNLLLSLTFTHWHYSCLGHFRFLCHSLTVLSFSVLCLHMGDVYVCGCVLGVGGSEKGICPMVPMLPAECQCPAAYCQGASQSGRTLGGLEAPLRDQPLLPTSASHLSFCHLNLWKSARRKPFRKTKEKTHSSLHVS